MVEVADMKLVVADRMAVVADTVAMSQPHEIDYALRFDSASLSPAAS